MKTTSKFFNIKTETEQEFVVRIESNFDHEDKAAVAVSEHLESPISYCREIKGDVACLKQMLGVQLIDPELCPA